MGIGGRPRKVKGPQYDNLGDLLKSTIDVLRPPERLNVSEAAEKYRYLVNPGSYTGPWKNSVVPYMRKPMDTLISRNYTACVFVAPAQCGKTDALLLNWLNYSIICDPADMILYQTAQGVARDFSRRRIDRLHRHTEEAGKRLMRRGDSDNTFDKFYTSGMMLTLSWPTINELSGRPVGRVAFTDYDRMELNIDGEGSPFDLGRKRTTTFGSFAMTLAESSPGYSCTNTKWVPTTKHEAPPAPGILSLYNRGDRQLYYWQCPNCSDWFEPKFAYMRWEDSKDLMDASESAYLECPHCHHHIEEEMKPILNNRGEWLLDGQKIDKQGNITGQGPRSDIASFWLKGPAASFQKWSQLVMNYLKAMEEYERSGDQNALRATVNTDQGEPYFERGTGNDRSPEDLAALAEDYGSHEPTVPEGVRFLYATIDVQANRWEVQVQGVVPPITEGALPDHVVIDRFAIQKSQRKDQDGERYYVKPHSYIEDWDLITAQVIHKSYPLADDSGRRMGIRMTACDSGGKKGVTGMAYNYWRNLRKEGLSSRFVLLKGTGSPNAPRTQLSYPDSNRRDRKAAARGEIPVLQLQTDKLKDELDNMLERKEPGGMIRFSSVLPDNFYRELTVEYKDLKGKWVNPKNLRQEAWDLIVYHLAMCHFYKIELLDWQDPPRWAAEWDENSLVTGDNNSLVFEHENKSDYALDKLGDILG